MKRFLIVIIAFCSVFSVCFSEKSASDSYLKALADTHGESLKWIGSVELN